MSASLPSEDYMQITPFYNDSPHIEFGIYFKTGTTDTFSTAYGSNFLIIYVPSPTVFSLTYNGSATGLDGTASITILQLRRNF